MHRLVGMKDGWEGVMGPEHTGHLTDNDKLLNLCAADKLEVGGSLFCHKVTRIWTWAGTENHKQHYVEHGGQCMGCFGSCAAG